MRVSEKALSPNDFPLALDIVGACIAATALVPLGEMSALVRSPGLKRAWRALTFAVLCGIVLLLLSVAEKIGKPLDVGDATAGMLHVLGPTFALTIAWLSRRSAQDMLRIEALEEAAFVDHLTGLANRRRFDETVVVERNHYFPADSVDVGLMEDSATRTICPWKGTAHYKTLVVDGVRNPDAVWYYPDPKPEAAEIKGWYAFWKGVVVG